MPDDLIVIDGSSFFVSDRRGDADPRPRDPKGYFVADTRHLSTWKLLAGGRPLHLLTSRLLQYHSARIYGTLAGAAVGVNPSLSIRRDRAIGGGVHEDVVVENHCQEATELRLELVFGADFADLFEVKEQRLKSARPTCDVSGGTVTLSYQHRGFRRATRIAFGDQARIKGDRAVYELSLEPRQRWQTCIEVETMAEGIPSRPRARHGDFGQVRPDVPGTLEEWLDEAPALEASHDGLRHAYRCSLVDLASLRFRPNPDTSWSVPAAGLPWFMALFGRDSLITSYQALPFQPQLARSTLEALAAYQARERDDFRDAQPGKILHELRRGELTVLGELPHSPYYGSHDATPLYLILLDEYERWTGDLELVRALEPAARAAVDWMDRHGDLDQDGYLEYQTRSSRGLVNQCWKDSWNSILFADGQLAEPPIATCELQGYAYDARRRTARLARLAWDDPAWAEQLEAAAGALRERFLRDFWDERRGHFLLALDARKRPVDALTSNLGHLLWSGIADPERAALTARQLLSEELFSGWGVRTMSSQDAGYNPIEYHNGTVWPHDTALAAEGLRRYGFRAEAGRVVLSLLEAAENFDYRLPEVFAGFSRAESRITVEYPTPSRPQAWSAGAVLLGLRTLLGLDVVDGRLRAEPALPEPLSDLRLRGVHHRGSRSDAP